MPPKLDGQGVGIAHQGVSLIVPVPLGPFDGIGTDAKTDIIARFEYGRSGSDDIPFDLFTAPWIVTLPPIELTLTSDEVGEMGRCQDG